MPKGYPKSGVNKGWFKKGISANPETQFKKGQTSWNNGKHYGSETQFKKGHATWNKGLKGAQPAPWNKGKTNVYPEDVRKKISASLRKKTTPLFRAVRDCFKMSAWIQSIYKRDDYTCKYCHSRGGKLAAHHKKPFIRIMAENNIQTLEQALFCDELWDLNNGETVCWKCHAEYHKKYTNGFSGARGD